MVRLSGWTVGYVIANQIALLVVTVLANGTDGGPFVYISAYAFFQLPHGLFAVSLMTTFAPELATAAARGDLAALRAQLSRGLRLAAVVIVPAAAMYLALARPIVVALLQRGAFSAADAADVADTLVAFAVGLLPFSDLPVRAARVLRRATTRSRRSGSTASRTRSTSCSRSRSTRGSASPGSRSRSRSRTSSARVRHPRGAPARASAASTARRLATVAGAHRGARASWSAA